MVTITVTDVADLATATIQEFGEMNWTHIPTDIQEYVAMDQLLKKDKVTFDGGDAIQFNIMTKHSGAAKEVGLFNVDNPAIGDVLTTGSIPWRHVETNYSFDVREPAVNRGAKQIVDLVKIRRADAMTSLTELCEQRFWGKPATSSDELKVFGVAYWIVNSSSEGWYGTNPSGFSAGAAGVSSTTYPRWSNWTARFTDVTKPDCVRKLRQAYVKTQFKPPVGVQTSEYNTGNKYGLYTNYNVLYQLEELLEAQNDNLGNDLASKDGSVTFRRTPITYVPHLDAANQTDITDPIYGINWGVFKPTFLSGDYFRESKSIVNHNIVTFYIDLTMNYICRDRRRCFVLDHA